MAIQLSKILDTRVTADHWVINAVYLNAAKMVTTISVAHYLNASVYDEGGMPLQIVSYDVPPGGLIPYFQAQSSLSASTLITACYNYLKDLPDFTGAKDA